MGTKIQSLPGYYSMRDLNEESSSCGWPLYYGDKTMANGQYYHNYLSSAAADVNSTHDKDVVKKMMLEHEAIFKNQVFELHRLYRIQRDMMDEVKMKDLPRNQICVETPFSAGPLASQITSEDGKKWRIPGFPIVGSSTCDRPSISSIEGIHSPLSSNKGISKQADLFPSPNGSSSKDVEILGFRPSKVRRKMFDLHLPADEYIDTEENENPGDEKISGTTKFLSDRNCKPDKGADVKLYCDNGGKNGSQEDISRPELCLRRGNGLADLNEPVHVEETNDVAHIPPQNHNPYPGETECSDLSVKQKSRFFGLSKEDLLNSHRGTDSWTRNNGYLENKRSEKMWISSLESGQAKSNLKPIPQVLKQEQSRLSSQTTLEALSKAHEHTSEYLTNQNRADLLREKTASGIDISERSHEYSANKHPEYVVSSHRHGLFAIAPSSDLAMPWSHSSWVMASSSLNQKLTSVQTPASSCLNSFGALSRTSQSHQSNGIWGDSWPININSKLNPSFQCEASGKNGCYPGTSSGSKELSMTTSSISYLNHDNDCKKFPEHCNNGSANCYRSSNLNSNGNDIKSVKDINLNEILSNGSPNNLVSQSSLGIMDGERKHEEQLALLPWLRSKTCKNEAQIAARSVNAGGLNVFQVASMSNKDETRKGSDGKFVHNVAPGLCSNDIEPRRTEVSESSSKRKILGVTIVEITHNSAKESSSFTSPSMSAHNPSDVELVENNWKKQILDINLPCDATVTDLEDQSVSEIVVCETGSSATKANSRNQIDLNLIMSEDETLLTTTPTTNLEIKPEIDLEAPAVPEIEEDAIAKENKLESPLVSAVGSQDTVEKLQDELMRHAAEAIVVLSTCCCQQVDDVISCSSESPVVDPLSWFADIVSSGVDDMPKKTDDSREKDGDDKEESFPEGMDYFESMTLKLTETKEEDYMPQPLVSENFKVEEPGTTSLPSRKRKGPARRGRQRRDFQRDILPGLASLSRHEVTEDLQTFGGLMRATGHAWTGLNRRSSSRNGCGRGRRRSQPQVNPSPPPPVATIETSTPLIQQLSNIEVGLEDRSLTGWGKTPRRPRRQRCPAGNPPSIRLI
ncbi:hypothetical protein Fmac_005889 [Flemingia macrophylla]|uniref:Uncharacterized protein n=1 Tax=Flemingia macrophylla TaxID=520843 RepID=A0ABD1N923_9FABA